MPEDTRLPLALLATEAPRARFAPTIPSRSHPAWPDETSGRLEICSG